ncbi:MAG TPA: ATP-binding protein [Burkholderiales bacterium]|nr:ATP-binding protein [Burkholderiales bacterium]
MKLLIIAGGTIAAAGLFLLATESGEASVIAPNYPLLLALNATLAVLLAALVGYQLVGLVKRYRARVFGTRLTLRLLGRFALLAVVPGLVVYAVSLHFLTKSIESWFDVKVDAALAGGITLGQQAIDQLTEDLRNKARAISLELADRPASQVVLTLERLRERAGVDEAVVVGASGRLVASASEDVSHLLPDLPAPQTLRQARGGRGYATVDAAPGKPLFVRVIMPLDTPRFGEELRYVQLRNRVPAGFSDSAEAVEAAYRDYRELALGREGLRRIYLVTLTFALLMALFVAIAVALRQSDLLAEPLANLAQATQAVARGDFTRQAPVTSRDELGVLTESFNSMMRQLAEARRGMESNRQALEAAKAHLESVLGNLSAGVLVFDHDLRLAISNQGAHAILGEELEPFAAQMREIFAERGERSWERELTLERSGRTLHARGAALPRSTGGGYVLVLDDISQLIQAQRATAWAEVARRLAHEIKNPLTPIQLSAERLELKLAGRLAPEDAAVLRRSTATIVSQVTALKHMVDDFRVYARHRTPVPGRLDINSLVSEVLGLYENSKVPITKRLAPGLPEVWADADQIRQVIHNLVQNAQDALENASPATRPAIEVRTELVDARVRLTVADNGPGFQDELLARIFEPYVTTKPRGTGLGLAIVKRILDEHNGAVEIDSQPTGATVSVLLPRAEAA